MSRNPLASKIAAPYARALFDYSNEQNLMHQVTADCQNLEVFLYKSSELKEYLSNPIASHDAKCEVLKKVLRAKVNPATIRFLMVLVKRDRINLLTSIVDSYLNIIYQTAAVKSIQVVSAYPFKNSQTRSLNQKLRKLTKAREIRLAVTVDPSLIGGFLIKTESKIIDFTIKNQLQKLAKHLDTVLEI